jgi:hypothetical protein
MSKRKSSDLGQIAKVGIIEVVCVCLNIAKIPVLAGSGGFSVPLRQLAHQLLILTNPEHIPHHEDL